MSSRFQLPELHVSIAHCPLSSLDVRRATSNNFAGKVPYLCLPPFPFPFSPRKVRPFPDGRCLYIERRETHLEPLVLSTCTSKPLHGNWGMRGDSILMALKVLCSLVSRSTCRFTASAHPVYRMPIIKFATATIARNRKIRVFIWTLGFPPSLRFRLCSPCRTVHDVFSMAQK